MFPVDLGFERRATRGLDASRRHSAAAEGVATGIASFSFSCVFDMALNR
jgi:hypothetical protein